SSRPRRVHRVDLEKAGFASAARVIEGGLREGRTYDVHVELRAVPTVHLSPVEADVFVNGRLVGHGQSVPLEALPEEGPVQVRIRAEGYEPVERRWSSARDVPEKFDVTLAASE
ncbi:MAG: PEGA domain-containing protein, partial [Myxococcales bacterium]|nr:PEGA domain-containing protein [Myxococcales bacterium]